MKHHEKTEFLDPAEDEIQDGYRTLSYSAGNGIGHTIFNTINVDELTPLEIFG